MKARPQTKQNVPSAVARSWCNRPVPKPAPSVGRARGLLAGVRTRAPASAWPGPEPVTRVTGSGPGAWATCRDEKMRRKAAAGLVGCAVALLARAPWPNLIALSARTGAVMPANRSLIGGRGPTPKCCSIVAAARGGPGAQPNCCARSAPQSVAVARLPTCNLLATHIRWRHCEALAWAVRSPHRVHTIM